LSFNYNSISFEVCPAGLGQPALISIDPWESGIKTTGNIVTKAGDQSAFTVDELQVQRSFKLRGTIGKEAPCQVRYRSIEQPTAYFGRTFVELLKYLGIAVGRTRSGAVEGQMQPFYTNESRPLSLILYEMNHFSTNFIAEQVLYWVGTPQAEAPDAENRSLSRLSGLRQMGYYLQEIGVPKDQYSLADASGLSHEDRISALGIVRALIDMRKTTAVSAEFENGLSVAGASGTLKKRLTDISPAVLRGKTGTLDGVSSLAGYLTGSQGATIAFAVLQNNTDKETAQLREDRFISILAGELQ
jgi:D-alanyl-D-alanine carboxypeptidase/D-alanyl-D-alanine-endopeptidase (penicillin-binding protein 4)